MVWGGLGFTLGEETFERQEWLDGSNVEWSAHSVCGAHVSSHPNPHAECADCAESCGTTPIWSVVAK